jgi:cytochrome c553
LRRKRTGQFAELRAPLAVCREGPGHDRLSCNSCHTPWAPRCTSCHTKFDPALEGFDHLRQEPVKGAWTESSGPFEAAPPTLGIRLDAADTARPSGIIDTFGPGMIMELDRNRTAGGPPDPVFRRLYARLAAHTTSRAVRSCQSCHNDPVALGYGRGTLRFEVAGPEGRWRFTPAHAPSPQDGLPADAWIGFLQTREGMVSTRDDVRPFTLEEQRRILRVGACLTCHADDSAVMKQSVSGFDSLLSRRRASCVLPVWSTFPPARP